MNKFYIVDAAIMPDVLDKVIEARGMLESGMVRQVSEAVKRVGISRGTYYKYKDYVFPATQGREERKAVISLMLHHKKGILSETLNCLSEVNANILTINQNIPVDGLAAVSISISLDATSTSDMELVNALKKLEGVVEARRLAGH